MSCFDVQILDPNINTIEIETCIGDQPASIYILTYDNTSVIEVNHCIALLPSEINDLITVKDILAGSGINVSDNSGIYTISLSDPIINSSDIVDLLEAVQDIIGNSGLASGNYININYDDNTGYTTISATGLQPSGNYSVDGHTHTSSNITDFNSSVSGLLPVKNISAGSGIGISSNSGDFTISVTGTFGLTGEQVDDRVNDLLKAGSYINLNYNDLGDALTISVTGLQPSGDYSVVGHSHVIADVSGLQNALDGKQPSGVYASGIHYHLSSDITDFNSAVSGLIPPSNFTSLTGLSGIAVTNSGTNYFVALSDPTIQLTDITDLSSNARTFLLTPSSSNLNTLISDETGSGNLVFNTSPSFSGTPTVPTAPSGTNSTQIASTAFVRTEISNLVDSSPSTLDTLNELAAALGDDPNFATTIASGLGQKANLSGAIFTGPVTIPSGTGNFNSLSVNNIPVSISGHQHSYTDIINFASGIDQEVSTLLVAGNYINLNYNTIADTLTISATGLQPSGSYANSVHNHGNISSSGTIGSTSGLLVTTTSGGLLTTASGIGSSYITDFNSSVSGLLPVISNSGDNRLLTSTGSSLGINAENNITFDGNLLNVIGNVMVSGYDGVQSIAPNVSEPGDFMLFRGDNYWDGTVFYVDGVGRGYFQQGLVVDGYVNIGGNITLGGSGLLSSNINNFNSSVSGLLPVKNILGSGYVNVSSVSGTYTVGVTGLQPSGNYSVVGHTHNTSDITNFASGVSGLLPSVTGTGYVASSFNNNIYTISVSGLQPSGNYSVVGHTHISSDITDFNNAVSGLLPVKDIVGGSGINISSLSGTYTVAVTGIAGLISEEVDDRVSQLLVAGTGVSLIYNDPSGTLTIDNRHTEVNILSEEPQGFVNRTDSLITFNDSTRTFTIQPAVSGSFYEVYVKGQKVVKNTAETVVLGSGTALNFLHFSTTAPYQLETKTTFFDFIDDVPISYIHWNSSTNQSTFFGEERHGIRMDTTTHKWIHNTFGIQYINGLSIGGYILAGNGTLDSHAQFDISDGVLYQEDIVINVTDDNGINSSEEFVQPLSPIAYIPVYYHLGTTGQWVRDSGSPFALKYNATRPFYNLYSPGPPPNWTIPNVDDNKYLAMWIVATNDINDPILAIMGQRQDSSLQLALDNNIWQDINLTNIPVFEFKPLYRLIFRVDDAYTNTPKAVLENILDLRLSIQTVNAGVSQNDHGSLFGLGDDDHPQYVHINDPRTITATHTFTNGLTISSGLLSATSGNFTSLTVNGTGVSVSGHSHISSDITNFNTGVSGLLPSVSGSGYVNSFFNNNIYTISVSGLQPSGNYSVVGHTHTASNITDFNSSVSGLLPTISNTLNNRLLTSIGTPVGINAETNLTFDGTTFSVGASPATIIAQSGITTAQINVDSLRLDNNVLSTTTANSDLILFPNGNGSLLADPSGNLRGIYSNDFQRERTSVSGVAAGSYNVICGGSDNRTANSYSVVCGGQTNVASNSWSMVGGGDLNNATGNRSVICGGGSNSSSAQSSTVGGGSNNQATGVYSIIPGGFRAKASRQGELSHSAGFFNAAGDAQHTILIARRLTTDATADVVLTLNGLAPVLTNVLTIPAQTMWTFSIKLSAYNVTNNEAAWWIFRGGIKRNNANSTVLIGSLITENGAESTLSTASAAVVADDTNEALEIRATGVTGKNIRWVAVVDISQVSFGTP